MAFVIKGDADVARRVMAGLAVNVPTWQPNTDYKKGDIVRHPVTGELYWVTVDHTSPATFVDGSPEYSGIGESGDEHFIIEDSLILAGGGEIDPSTVPGKIYRNTQISGAGGITGTNFQVDYLYKSDGSSWIEIVPKEGYTLFDKTANTFELFDGTAWVKVSYDEVVVDSQDPFLRNSGLAFPGEKLYIRTTTNELFYESGGGWVKVNLPDRYFTAKNKSSNTAGFFPISPPSGQIQAGHIHLEVYSDKLVWFLWDGTFWSSAAETPVAPSAASNISPAADDGTGAVGTSTAYAREDHKHPAQGVSSDANNSLVVGSDGLHFFAHPDEVITNAGALTGAAPANAQWGIDTTTGASYYVDGSGNWQPSPVASVDLNMTVSDQSGNNAGASPLSAPGSPDTGDVHLELYDDALVWWSWNGTTWVTAGQTPTNPNAATVIPPASDDGTGAVGTSVKYAREDHKHPAQGVSANAGNRITVGSDGLHYLDGLRLHQDTADPAGTNDSSQGYLPGDRWFNSSTNKVWTCLDNTAGAAKWQRTDVAIVTSTTAPTATDDIADGYAEGTIWVDTAADKVYMSVDSTAASAVWKDLTPAASGPYNTTFNATTDWTLNGTVYELTVSQATHGKTAAQIRVDVYEDDGTNYVPVTPQAILINKSTGDLTMQVPASPDARFAGNIVIS